MTHLFDVDAAICKLMLLQYRRTIHTLRSSSNIDIFIFTCKFTKRRRATAGAIAANFAYFRDFSKY